MVVMVAAMFLFAVQDGISRYLAGSYNTYLICALRYWVFAGLMMAHAARQAGGIRGAFATGQPLLQLFRGMLLGGEVLVTVEAFVRLGLITTHAIFASYPLIVLLLARLLLGERLRLHHGLAVLAGFVGVLIMLRPGMVALGPDLILPVLAAFMFALYQVLTRLVARQDRAATSFVWTGLGGLIVTSAIAPFHLQPITGPDLWWLAALSAIALGAHFLLVKALELTEAGRLQPLSYTQLVFVLLIGIGLFGERPDPATLIGAAVIVAAGLVALRSRPEPGEG